MIPIRWGQAVLLTLLLVVLLAATGCSGGGGGGASDTSAKDAGATGTGGEPVRYKFKEGEKLRYVSEAKTTTQGIIAGEKTRKIDNTFVAEIVWEITGVDKDGRANVTATLDRIRMTIDGPMGKMEYDSKNVKEPEDEFFQVMAKNFKSFVGGQATLTVDPKGQVTDVKYLGKLAEIAKTPGGLNAMYSSIIQMVAVQLLRLPHEQMKKGDTWSDRSRIPGLDGAISVEQTCVWEGPTEHDGRTVDRIAIQLAGEADPKPGPFGEKWTITGGKGVAYFDRNAGRMLELSVTITSESEKKVARRPIRRSSRTSRQ